MSDEIFGPDDVIYAYTREQALADGVLVDVSEWASPAQMRPGWTCSVVFTAALWASVNAIPRSLQGIADVRGRAHDVLFLAAIALRGGSQGMADFRVILPTAGTRTRIHRLRVVGNDEGITIGFPSDF